MFRQQKAIDVATCDGSIEPLVKALDRFSLINTESCKSSEDLTLCCRICGAHASFNQLVGSQSRWFSELTEQVNQVQIGVSLK